MTKTKTKDAVGPIRGMAEAAASWEADPLRPVHPGEIVREEFMLPLGLNAPRAAAAMGVPRTRIERLWREETPITADTALRLERFLGPSAMFWLNLQSRYDLQLARPGVEPFLADIARFEAVKGG